MTQLKLARPDDWHLHLRQGEVMRSVVGMTAKQMGRAIVMPNLSPPVRNAQEALSYRNEIVCSLPKGTSFNPLMTLYLTDKTTKQNIIEAGNNEHVYAVKLYPAGATTNSESGVTSVLGVYPVIEQMQKEGVPLLVHGEVTHADIDVFDREKVFIETVLAPLELLAAAPIHSEVREAGLELPPRFLRGLAPAPRRVPFFMRRAHVGEGLSEARVVRCRSRARVIYDIVTSAHDRF